MRREVQDKTRQDKKDDSDTPDENPGATVVSLLDRGEADWAIVTNGKIWRLYAAKAHSRATNYYEIDLEETLALPETSRAEAFRYFWLFFRLAAFVATERVEGGQQRLVSFLDNLVSESERYARELGERLKERVFEEIFPHFARGFIVYARRNNGLPTDFDQLADADRAKALEPFFSGTLTFLYRLLFLLYAESRDLLPVREVRGYYEKSLEKLKRLIADRAGTLEDEAPANLRTRYNDLSTEFYDGLQELFRAVDRGDPTLNVPTYNGGLFMTDPAPDDLSPEAGVARFLALYKIPDRELALGLDRMSRDVDERRHDLAFIDYKSLGVRQLGSIYEGLLEFKLRIAAETMAVVKGKKTEEIVPLAEAQARKLPLLKDGRGKAATDRTLPRGTVYLENDRRERKATGSYYTPDYIVKYIVENTVGPVLKEKLEALRPVLRAAEETLRAERAKYEALKKAGRTGDSPENQTFLKHRAAVNEPFFDLRVLDPAMGSGHFLVEAVDYVTDRLADFLSQFRWNPVVYELTQTRRQIQAEMERQGVSVDASKLTDINLLKRQVLKRCIYGVDLNPMAVELAKVSLWLDCFTLGAPLSFLDHHLKAGNSLIGGSVGEVQDALRQDLFGNQFAGLLSATSLMQEVGRLSDITVEQVAVSRTTYRQAYDALAPFKRLLDVWISEYFGNKGAQNAASLYTQAIIQNRVAELKNPADRLRLETALQLAPAKRFFHWELEFPEVFYDETSRKPDGGFDAVVGNPPYVATNDLRQSDLATWKYYKEVFRSAASGKLDIYLPFFEKAWILIKSLKGRASFILPNKWIKSDAGVELRRLFSSKTAVETILDFGSFQIFQGGTSENGPTTYTSICTVTKTMKENLKYALAVNEATDLSKQIWTMLNYKDLSQAAWSTETGFWNRLSAPFFASLEDLSNVFVGTSTNADPIFIVQKMAETDDLVEVFSEEEQKVVQIEKAICIPFLRGKDIGRFNIINTNLLVIFPYYINNVNKGLIEPETFILRYPLAWKYLVSHKTKLEARENGKWIGRADWYCHSYPRAHSLIKVPKILTPDICEKGRFSLDKNGIYHSLNTVYGITNPIADLELSYLLCILNTRAFEHYIKANSVDLRGGYYRVTKNFISPFPIRRINFTTPDGERARLLEEMKGLYRAGDGAGGLQAVADCLPLTPDGQPDTAREKSDVVHDLLAFLAEEMIQLNRQKRVVQQAFVDWLIDLVRVQPDKEGKTGLDVLTGKTQLADWPGDYQKSEPALSLEAVLDILQKNKTRLGVRLSEPALPGQITARYNAALAAALPLKQKLAATDRLIDGVVYKLYGVSEEEINVIEGTK